MNDAASARRDAWGWTLAFIGSFAFSAKAILVKLAYQHPVDALTLITLRMLIALPLFAGLAWWAGRGRAHLTSRDWLAVLGLGFSGYYLSSLLDFAGLQYISASLERLIFYLSPTIVLVLGLVLHKRVIKPLHLAGIAVSYVGIVLVFVRELNAGGVQSTARICPGFRKCLLLLDLPGLQCPPHSPAGLAALGGLGHERCMCFLCRAFPPGPGGRHVVGRAKGSLARIPERHCGHGCSRHPHDAGH